MDEELALLNEEVGKRALMEDIQYFSKELSFKVDKGELEGFRQDFVDRMISFDQRLSDGSTALTLFGAELESKVES